MTTRRETLARLRRAADAGVTITNYGLCISFLQGVLERALGPFPAALDAFKRSNKREAIQMTTATLNRHESSKYMLDKLDFIDDAAIETTIRATPSPDPVFVRAIIQKALSIETLAPDETATLLNVTSPDSSRQWKRRPLP